MNKIVFINNKGRMFALRRKKQIQIQTYPIVAICCIRQYKQTQAKLLFGVQLVQELPAETLKHSRRIIYDAPAVIAQALIGHTSIIKSYQIPIACFICSITASAVAVAARISSRLFIVALASI